MAQFESVVQFTGARKKGQIHVSYNRLRQIVEDEGQRSLKARDKGLIGPSWDALDSKTNANSTTRVKVGADGVMVPLVTQSEKQKIRKNRRTRRREKTKLNGTVVHRFEQRENDIVVRITLTKNSRL